MEVTPTVQHFKAVRRRVFQRGKLMKLIIAVIRAENAYFRSENRRWRQTKGMDSELYSAAQTGQWDVVMSNYADQFLTQQTANRGTVLHVLAQCCNSSDAAQQILEREPHLLLAVNEQNETALHLAAINGHSDVVLALIDDAKRSENIWRYVALLTRTDVNGNTALHKAVGNNRSQVVKFLAEEDPEFEYDVNIAGESPLYIAVENGFHDVVELILSTCKSPSYEGPGETTALHAAVIRNSPEYVGQILEKLPLIKKVDKIGWTALHYAAKYNHQEVVKLLLSKDKFTAYIAALKDDCKTALHVAATHGHVDVITEILSCVPDCWEGITSKRQNIFHLAVQHEHGEVVEFILNNPLAIDLINQKDVDGNTPLHFYVTAKELQVNNLVKLSGMDMNPFNNSGLTPLGMIPENEEVTDRQRTIRDELKQAGANLRIRNVATIIKDKPSTGNALKQAAGAITNVTTTQSQQDQPFSIDEVTKEYTVVAALIITVTFAACFTVPGGYDNQGKAVLANNTTFTLFVATDLLAMEFSIVAILLLFLLIGKKTQSGSFERFRIAKVCIGIAMAFMSVAFFSGGLAVLPTKLPAARPVILAMAIIIGFAAIAISILALVRVCRSEFAADRFTAKHV